MWRWFKYARKARVRRGRALSDSYRGGLRVWEDSSGDCECKVFDAREVLRIRWSGSSSRVEQKSSSVYAYGKTKLLRLLLLWAPSKIPVSQEWPGPCCNCTTWMDICPSSPRAVITPPMRSTPSPAAANSGPSRITVIPVPSKPASTQIELLPTSRASGAQGHTTTIEGSALTILPPELE
ncbi:hypothetical protein BT96DRAFT_513126 [Gymnopus androsaceus JB14]|uniref:Uncharacterized protein n=1 Tax=Gymnopus androsaceus JB14 TaxID=1447944 RepID=A0A6A4GMA3_9AGAR|nr:hypothetical protein BT96DRAFT_513126 [Gymnopus androsaceus JB14]